MSGTSGLVPLIIGSAVAPTPPAEITPLVMAPFIPGPLQPWVNMRQWLVNNQPQPNATSGIWSPIDGFNWAIILDPVLDVSGFNIPSLLGTSPWLTKNLPDGYSFNLGIICSSGAAVDINWTADWLISTVVTAGFVAAAPAGSGILISCVATGPGLISAQGIITSVPTVFSSF